MNPSIESRASMSKQFLAFKLDDRLYCCDLLSIREVRRIDDFTPVPQVNEHLIGVINLRGEIVPLLDLRARLGGASSLFLKGHVALVIGQQDRLCAALVDSVLDVIDVAEEKILPVPGLMNDESKALWSGIIEHKNQTFVALNLQRAMVITELEAV
jgi:purine-binding chemotaxis protein CheW